MATEFFGTFISTCAQAKKPDDNTEKSQLSLKTQTKFSQMTRLSPAIKEGENPRMLILISV